MQGSIVCGQPNLKRQKQEKEEEVKVSKISQSDSHRLTVPHQKKKKKMLSFIYKFHFILYKFIQSFRINRERETESLRES